MNRLMQLAAVMFLVIAGAQQAVAETSAIYAGQLLAVPGQAPQTEQTVVIENGVIKSVSDGYTPADQLPEGTKIVDLKQQFVMPGLMDMHVHLQFELGPNNDSEALKLSDFDVAMRSTLYAQRTLMAGFTTVRDLGSHSESMYAMRDAINKGWIAGPRIVAGGGVAITGGHTDVSGVSPELMELYTKPTVCDGPYDCRRAARRAIKYGADLIKIASTGGVLSQRATGTGQQMESDEMENIVQAAHRMGRKVAAHAHAEDGIIAALKAGVDSIEHGSYTNKEAIKLFKQTGAYLVPTLLAGDTVVQMATNSDFMIPAVKEKAIRVGGDMMRNFSAAYKAGVKVAYGTDSGVSAHGLNGQEAVLMAKAGMQPMEIIQAATVNAADLIDMSSTLGTLEPGKQADIIATTQSPLNDISELTRVIFVMKGGEVHKQP